MDYAKLQAQLIRHEGLKLKPYVDTVGKVTIGVGHNLTDKGLTRPQAMSLLRDDINDVIQFTVAKCPWFHDLDDVRQRAIADLIFVVGSKILTFTHLIAGLKAKDWKTASNELLNSKFSAQTGSRAQELAQMLLTGVDPNVS